jgi:hypothetical protein
VCGRDWQEPLLFCAGPDAVAVPALAAKVTERCAFLDVPFDPDAFREGVEKSRAMRAG